MKESKRFTLIVLRHGNTFESHEIARQVGCNTDLALTVKGLAQAQQFTDLLKTKCLSPTRIYCGALQRQRKTAEIIQSAFPEAALFNQQLALNEIDYGAWEGLTSDEIIAKWPNEYDNWVSQGLWPTNVFHSSVEHHLHSLNKWIADVALNVPDKGLVVAVSSNGIIRFMLQWLPALWEKLVAEKKMESYKVGTGNYCELSFEGLVTSVKAWNKSPRK